MPAQEIELVPDDMLQQAKVLPVPDWGPFDGAPGLAEPPASRSPEVTAGDLYQQSTGCVAGGWPWQFARLMAEALAGCRPARQILPWTGNRARSQFRRVLPGFGNGQPPRIVRVLATMPDMDVIEMSVIAGFGPRTRALALRLERTPATEGPARPWPNGAMTEFSGWLCTDIEAA